MATNAAWTRLPRLFYRRATVTVAQDLLGKLIVHHDGRAVRVGRIVETEAYLGPHDLASHSRMGPTARNAAMFGPVGHAYVYLVYGVHECLNVVTDSPGAGAAVLLRAVEPVEGCTGRTSGPGLLARALRVTRALDGTDLTDKPLFLATDSSARPAIVATQRIGVGYARHWARRRLRFYIRGNSFVSRA